MFNGLNLQNIVLPGEDGIYLFILNKYEWKCAEFSFEIIKKLLKSTNVKLQPKKNPNI